MNGRKVLSCWETILFLRTLAQFIIAFVQVMLAQESDRTKYDALRAQSRQLKKSVKVFQ